MLTSRDASCFVEYAEQPDSKRDVKRAACVYARGIETSSNLECESRTDESTRREKLEWNMYVLETWLPVTFPRAPGKARQPEIGHTQSRNPNM